MIKKLGGIAASLLLAGLVTVGLTTPAEAAVSTRICHSSDSSDHSPIQVYQAIYGNWAYTVEYGTCGPWLGNSNDEIRVDTCPSFGNGSAGYWIKSDSGYGPFHSGCNGSSNPPNYNGTVYYKLKH